MDAFMEADDTRLVLKQKLRRAFDGKIVRKDLTKHIKEGANVPVYVLEFLLGQYCSSDDEEIIEEGVNRVKRILADNFVRPDEAQKVLSVLRERGSYTVIDKITVHLNIKEDRYEAEFSNLGIRNVPIHPDYPSKFDRLLCGGIWCILQLDYEFDVDDKKMNPIRIRKLTPIQMPHIDMSALKAGREDFTKEEWLSVLLRSTGMEPEKLSERARWLLLARMIPLVENNFNLCELGPRSTGKSHIYKEISPNSILVSGGQTTVANLFYNMASKTVGLVGMWDVVAFDEVAGITFKDWDGHFASLLGGALFYSENYVKQNKNTLYFKKWNVMNGLEDVGEGQYMTNVQGAESEAAALRKGYLSLLDSPMIFEIPIYSGMPDAACRKPSGNNASSQPELPKEEEPKIKKEQTVTTNYTRYTRKVTDKGFNLNAKTDGDGVLTYASSDDRIASVDQSGQVRVNGVEGVVTFTVSASETETCKAGSKIVTLTVKKSEEQQEAERLQKMLTLADAIRLKASSTKNAGGSIQVKLTITQGDIAAIEDLGYTVKYKYYRSEKKNADYRSKVEKQTMTPYVNTAGIKNTRYYYKSRVMIYDADGSLAAYTRLDRCSYACRIWTKE